MYFKSGPQRGARSNCWWKASAIRWRAAQTVGGARRLARPDRAAITGSWLRVKGRSRTHARRGSLTFEGSKLKWSELAQPPHSDLHAWYRQLIRMRRSEPSLADGRLDLVKTHCDETERWLVVERGPLTMLYNFGDSDQHIPVRRTTHKSLLASVKIPPPTDGAAFLPGATVAILKQA